MPRGFKEDGYVLKSKKSLYVLKQSSRNFFELLSKQLLRAGLKPSNADPCLSIGKEIVLITYVDDLLCFGKGKEPIVRLITNLREAGTELKEESDA